MSKTVIRVMMFFEGRIYKITVRYIFYTVKNIILLWLIKIIIPTLSGCVM